MASPVSSHLDSLMCGMGGNTLGHTLDPRLQSLRKSDTYTGASRLYPGASRLFPAASRLFPAASRLYPGASRLYLGASWLFPGANWLFPCVSVSCCCVSFLTVCLPSLCPLPGLTQVQQSSRCMLTSSRASWLSKACRRPPTKNKRPIPDRCITPVWKE